MMEQEPASDDRWWEMTAKPGTYTGSGEECMHESNTPWTHTHAVQEHIQITQYAYYSKGLYCIAYWSSLIRIQYVCIVLQIPHFIQVMQQRSCIVFTMR